MGTHPIFESDFDCLTEMIRLSRRFLNQHKKYGMAFLPVEQKYQETAQDMLDHYSKRPGWGTFRSEKDVKGRIAQVGPSVSSADLDYATMREGIAYATKSFQNA